MHPRRFGPGILAACAAAVFLLNSLMTSKSLGQGISDLPPLPELEREFRGVWVATVANIDWPSKPGLSTEDQKSQAINILDRFDELRLNVIVLQVRTSCDELY
ncbi:MAG: family 10 glycosylhydrolase [Planctomycetota bacterium]